LIRNRQAREEAMERRRRLLELHQGRTQADPRLTVDAICVELGISRSSVKRHCAWLRQHGYLSRSGSFTRTNNEEQIAPHETCDLELTR
jgi:hypothetical protein